MRTDPSRESNAPDRLNPFEFDPPAPPAPPLDPDPLVEVVESSLDNFGLLPAPDLGRTDAAGFVAGDPRVVLPPLVTPDVVCLRAATAPLYSESSDDDEADSTSPDMAIPR